MDRRATLFLTGLVCATGAVVALALTVSPFDYDPLVGVAAAFVGAALFQTALDDATFEGA